jgi:hypothetical protein
MAEPRFTKLVVAEVQNDIPPGQMNTFSTVGDINGDGRPDIVVSGRQGRLVWLENRGAETPWPVHVIDGNVDKMECGGVVRDLTGNGLGDVINGNDSRGNALYWWENPGPDGGEWKRRIIAETSGSQFHDTTVGKVAGEDRASLLFTNQRAEGGTTVYRVPFPADPTVSPWPGLEVITRARTEENPYNQSGVQPEEGLAVGDIDGDGENEIVCGTHWYKSTGEPGAPWRAYKFARGYLTTKIAVGDLDGDGRNEIVLSEGDPCVYGKRQGGKVSWFKAPDDITGMWEEHVLEDFLFDAHSLQLADLCGNGRLDILVGEIGKADRTRSYVEHQPRIMVWENNGDGTFTRHIVDEGTGIHDAVLADMRGTGALDIVGKPLHGPEIWNVHVYIRDPA